VSAENISLQFFKDFPFIVQFKQPKQHIRSRLYLICVSFTTRHFCKKIYYFPLKLLAQFSATTCRLLRGYQFNFVMRILYLIMRQWVNLFGQGRGLQRAGGRTDRRAQGYTNGRPSHNRAAQLWLVRVIIRLTLPGICMRFIIIISHLFSQFDI